MSEYQEPVRRFDLSETLELAEAMAVRSAQSNALGREIMSELCESGTILDEATADTSKDPDVIGSMLVLIDDPYEYYLGRRSLLSGELLPEDIDRATLLTAQQARTVSPEAVRSERLIVQNAYAEAFEAQAMYMERLLGVIGSMAVETSVSPASIVRSDQQYNKASASAVTIDQLAETATIYVENTTLELLATARAALFARLDFDAGIGIGEATAEDYLFEFMTNQEYRSTLESIAEIAKEAQRQRFMHDLLKPRGLWAIDALTQQQRDLLVSRRVTSPVQRLIERELQQPQS